MTIQVTVTCAWCQTTKTTDLEKPVPEGWINEEVKDPKWAETQKFVVENFCCEEHLNHYTHYAPKAHEKASIDYTAKFYAEMNALRKKETEEPRELRVKVANN